MKTTVETYSNKVYCRMLWVIITTPSTDPLPKKLTRVVAPISHDFLLEVNCLECCGRVWRSVFCFIDYTVREKKALPNTARQHNVAQPGHSFGVWSEIFFPTRMMTVFWREKLSRGQQLATTINREASLPSRAQTDSCCQTVAMVVSKSPNTFNQGREKKYLRILSDISLRDE